MQFKRKLFIAFFVLDILLVAISIGLAFFPEIYIQNNLVVSESFEPPEDFAVQLNPNHEYFLKVTCYFRSNKSATSIELNLMLNNSTYKIWRVYESNQYDGGIGLFSYKGIIPMNPEYGGLLEIVVLDSSSIYRLKYAVFQDVPEKFVYLIEKSGGLPFLFMLILVVGVIWYAKLYPPQKKPAVVRDDYSTQWRPRKES